MAQSLTKGLILITASLGLIACSNASNTKASDWKTYTNKNSHFSFLYPNTLQPSTSFNKTYFSQALWSVSGQAISNNNQQHNIVELPIYNTNFNAPGLGDVFYHLLIRVGLSRNTTDIKNCTDTVYPSYLGKAKKTTINSIPFTVIPYQDGAMMKVMNASMYRTLHNKACYSLEIITYKTNVDLPKKQQAAVKKEKAIANQIVKSFNFTSD